MSINPVVAPFPIFPDRDGQPLEAGFVYIGTANLDPVTNPIAIFWDAALTISASQPVRTLNGYASRNGSPGALFAASDFSITVKDKQGLLVVTNPSGARSGLGDIVLAAGESLTAQAGSSIAVQDGATVGIGTGTGVGVLVTVASNARWVGDIVPNVHATQSLGTSTRKWDAQLDVATVSQVTAGTVNAATVNGFSDATVAATPTSVITANQQKNIAACGRISSSGVIGTNHFNIVSTAVVGTGERRVTLDQAIEDDAIVMANATGIAYDTYVVGDVQAGGASIIFYQYNAAGAAADLNFSFLVISRPRGGVTIP